AARPRVQFLVKGGEHAVERGAISIARGIQPQGDVGGFGQAVFPGSAANIALSAGSVGTRPWSAGRSRPGATGSRSWGRVGRRARRRSVPVRSTRGRRPD